jgi:hypothetical protein
MTNSLRTSLLGFGLLVAGTAAAEELRITGPFTHENLSVYLIHGGRPAAKTKLLPLGDAMAQKKVAVYETGNVSQLSIENLSAEDVYVQSGDIVKGGQQDRVLTTDFLLPAHSGKLPISSFCVEPGRWTKRGAEPATHFSASTAAVPSKELKMAVRDKGAQNQVWNFVGVSRAKLTEPRAAGLASLGPPSTSMQMAMEAKPVVDATEAYTKTLASVIDGKSDVVGYVYAINGAVNSAEVYSSNDLFRRMWPKLLRASATEALAERPKAKATAPPTIPAVKSALADAERATASSKDTAGKTIITRRESSQALLFETHDPKAGDEWIHRSYLVK